MDSVAQEVLGLSSGTIATLVGSNRYADIEAYQEAFFLWVVERPGFSTWVEAHQAYEEEQS